MPTTPPDPDMVAQVVAARAEGASLRELAVAAGVSAPTIKRWLDEIATRPPASPVEPAHMAPAAGDPLLAALPAARELDTGDLLGLVRELVRDQHEQIQHFRKTGQAKAAGSAAAVIAKLATLLKQVEQAHAADKDAIVLSRDGVDRAMAAVRSRVTLACARPLLCEECSRALSIAWGTTANNAIPAARPVIADLGAEGGR